MLGESLNRRRPVAKLLESGASFTSVAAPRASDAFRRAPSKREMSKAIPHDVWLDTRRASIMH